ncbi:hypothetical protein NBRC3257_1379 [Gluconobacter thailandicus NBRC 3257]|uniref:Uncharacterized protein n=1 Tax=Gluconobacter thailandicus NBRC 3257 TaxID=1381097 RepID=A0ABQ0IW05_GLUTH|nr:hypothetical protein NBRC3255_1463 [Gluconobacter thailandicus NBRC 3255]GAD26380.1 hypothetical protein NBRC3257_1379 [Gluconobacter thailandicus NBRC 3257]
MAGKLWHTDTLPHPPESVNHASLKESLRKKYMRVTHMQGGRYSQITYGIIFV